MARATAKTLKAVWSHSREWSGPETLEGEVRSSWLFTVRS